jgi:hypothetical protein
MVKACKVCLLEKQLSDFYSAKGRKDGTWHTCKSCTLIKQNAYNNSRKEIRKKQAAERYVKNREDILAKNKEWAGKHRYLFSGYSKKWAKNNPDKVKMYYELNKEKYIATGNEYRKKRESVDFLFKLKIRLRNRVFAVLKQNKITKNSRTSELIGCSLMVIKLHLEKQFKKGMSWENYGKWHIDHIVPLASAKNEEDLIKLFHYTNIQPLWAKENLVKSKKIPQVQTKLTI